MLEVFFRSDFMKFNIIYADPPWSYKTYSNKGKGRSAENHYKTLSIEDIKNIDIQSIADDNCILFLWVTFPCLIEGLETIKAWGFTYKTVGFCWVKRYPKQTDKWFWGLGFWTKLTFACKSRRSLIHNLLWIVCRIMPYSNKR